MPTSDQSRSHLREMEAAGKDVVGLCDENALSRVQGALSVLRDDLLPHLAEIERSSACT